MREHWNERYSAKEYIYGKSPNERFSRLISNRSPGRLLLPGEGEGRNAVFAAQQGWEVVALDQSEEGRCKALALAEESGVVIRYELGDLATMPLPSGSFDLISLIFVHFPGSIRTEVHHRLLEVLAPGGTFHLVAFRPEQLKFGTGGPRDVDLLYTEDLLRQDFHGLSGLSIQILDDAFSEGSYHQGRYAGIELSGVKAPH
ncbi:MAG TPA: class I SAM-dependent methyltransferase [Bacteroidales bacterium]|nr:class I SAM-dependent methyltransferase [Bacteroidales bacterium]HRZ77612.1 class I SAM-dependent methyltransferase [Bacteroidales bacterium]